MLLRMRLRGIKMIKNKRDLAVRLIDYKEKIKLCDVSKGLIKCINRWINSGDIKIENNVIFYNAG